MKSLLLALAVLVSAQLGRASDLLSRLAPMRSLASKTQFLMKRPHAQKKRRRLEYPMETTMDAGLEAVPIWDFSLVRSLEEFKRLVAGATVVLAHDRHTGRSIVAYGAEVLRAIRSEVIPPQRLAPVRFAVDFSNEDVDALCEALQLVNGFHEWPQ
jgi:hypothetical protein